MTTPRLTAEALFSDPLTAFREARTHADVAESELGDLVALRHDTVREALADPRLHSNFLQFLASFGVTSGPFYEWMAISPLNREGADHHRWRALLSRTFTPRAVERLRPFLSRAAHQLIDDLLITGTPDFMAGFADIYPSLGLCELIGVPPGDRDRFRGWADTIGLGFNPIGLLQSITQVDDALTQLLAYTGELAARRRTEPRDDLVTRIAQAAAEDAWTHDEVNGAIAGLVFAGHETTKNQLGWMIWALASHPDVWNRVADGSVTATDVIEELLRYRSAVTTTGRSVTEPVVHGGTALAADSRIILSLWSANHDERAYPQPAAFAPGHNGDAPHLAFGHGAHHCLGAALARAELQEALAALAARLECPRLADGAVWKPPLGITGPERLPVRLVARPAA